MAPADPRYRRLLLIDDEPGIRKLMALDLGADGYQVYTAADGAEGLEVFRRQRPDIVLTDLKMPGMDGIEVLRRIKQESPDTEVIVITGHGDLELAIQSLQLRASDFVCKPIDSRALEVALARATERLALRDQLRSYTEELEQRVAEATARVVAAERLAAIGQTVAALAHSIKNMLSGLKGGIYLVEEGLGKADREVIDTGLDMLKRNQRRLASLVRDLLTLSKPRRPELSPAPARELLAEAAECMQAEAEAKGVTLELLPGGEDLLCRVERAAIVDSLANLISNAIDAAATVEGGRVRLWVEENQGEVHLAVDDNGPGLDQEALDHIFEGFYSSKGAAGTGLGLMVAQKNAREHGGRVEFDNRPGRGVTFRLVLPAADGRRAADAA